MPRKSPTELAAFQKKAAKIAAIVGMVLALVCHALPPKYQVVCNLAAQIAPHACG